jgi:CheY-like chemotaxis protein
MLLPWFRVRAKRAKRGPLAFRRCRLAFERLEDRCLLSAKPVPLQAGGALLADQPTRDLQLVSLLATSESLTVTPADANSPLNVPIASISPPSQQSVPANKNSPSSALQNIGTDLTGDNLSLGSNAGLLPDDAGEESSGLLLGAGNLSTGSADSGLDNLSPGQGNLLLNQGAAANNVASSGIDGLLLEGGVFLGQGTNSSGSHLRGGGLTITATPVVSVNNLSDSVGNPSESNGAGQNAPAGASDSPAWESSNQALMRWLSTSWTSPTPESHVGESAAYPPSGSVQNISPTIPYSSLTVQKLVGAGVGNNTDHGPQSSTYSVGFAGDASYSAGLSGRDSEWLEKPGGGSGALAKTALASETGDTAAAASNSSGSRDAMLTFGLAGLGGEPVARQPATGVDAKHASDLAPSTVNVRPVNLLSGEALVDLQIVDAVSRMGLFQLDVARGTPVRDDVSMRDSGGSTAAYLGSEQSSIWTVVTTYSLVILPRQRKPQLTILVVDPDDATRDAVNVALVRAGYFVLPAASVRDAWGMLRTPHARIDLVLLDPHLPDVSGIHLCARLREISPTVPVMVCAGDVEPGEVDQLRQLGVRYYLRKPIAFEELLHTVRAILA